jgi:hypothetical protein
MPEQKISDHDLLIQLDERLRSIDRKLDAHLSDNGEVVKDHELRLRRLELWGAMSIGALAILQLVAEFALR